MNFPPKQKSLFFRKLLVISSITSRLLTNYLFWTDICGDLVKIRQGELQSEGDQEIIFCIILNSVFGWIAYYSLEKRERILKHFLSFFHFLNFWIGNKKFCSLYYFAVILITCCWMLIYCQRSDLNNEFAVNFQSSIINYFEMWIQIFKNILPLLML